MFVPPFALFAWIGELTKETDSTLIATGTDETIEPETTTFIPYATPTGREGLQPKSLS